MKNRIILIFIFAVCLLVIFIGVEVNNKNLEHQTTEKENITEKNNDLNE